MRQNNYYNKKKINKTRCGDCARCEMFKTTVVGKEKLINTKKKQTTTKNKAKYYLNIKLNIVLMNQLKKDTSNIYSWFKIVDRSQSPSFTCRISTSAFSPFIIRGWPACGIFTTPCLGFCSFHGSTLNVSIVLHGSTSLLSVILRITYFWLSSTASELRQMIPANVVL